MDAVKLSAVLLLTIDSAAGLVAGVGGLSQRSVAHSASRNQSPLMEAPVRGPTCAETGSWRLATALSLSHSRTRASARTSV